MDDVDALDAETLPAVFEAAHHAVTAEVEDRPEGVGFVEPGTLHPGRVFGHEHATGLRGHDEGIARATGEGPAQPELALAVTVERGGVEEIQSPLERALDGGGGLGIRNVFIEPPERPPAHAQPCHAQLCLPDRGFLEGACNLLDDCPLCGAPRRLTQDLATELGPDDSRTTVWKASTARADRIDGDRAQELGRRSRSALDTRGPVRYKSFMRAARLIMCCCSQARVLPGARDRAVEARTD